MLLVDLLDRLEIGGMLMQLHNPTGTTSLGRSSGTTFVHITSLKG
jgi:hypothetical protein